MRRVFVELPSFMKDWSDLRLTSEAMRELQAVLLSNPDTGDLLSGCAGMRKIRWGRAGSGKSGGVRVFYYDWPTKELTFFIAIIAKSEKENLDKSERNELADLIRSIKERYL